MTYSELATVVRRTYGPVIALRRVAPYAVREKWRMAALGISILLLLAAASSFAIEKAEYSTIPILSTVGAYAHVLFGLFLISFCCAFVLSAIEAFHRSYYFKGLEQVLSEPVLTGVHAVAWEVAVIVADTPAQDATLGFLRSEYGQEILFRAGVAVKAYADFLKNRQVPLPATQLVLESTGTVTLETYMGALLAHDNEFAQFLARENIVAQQAIDAAAWVDRIEHRERLGARWWSRDNLGRIPGLGKTWGYGETYYLERHGHDLTDDPAWYASAIGAREEKDEVEDMEKVLARARQSNVVLVARDQQEARLAVTRLYRSIRQGACLPQLEARRIFLIDLVGMFSATGNKTSCEQELIRLMNQAVSAGNIMLYFESFSTAVAGAQGLGVDLMDILRPYLESADIQVVITTEPENYHRILSRDMRIMQLFDKVELHDVDQHALIRILEQRAVDTESRTGVVMSIPALYAVARLADRYFPGGVMPDKALDLLEELVPFAQAHNKEQLVQGDVEQLVQAKTHVPIGEPTHEERQKLLSLEDFLHRRVVGQDAAINAVARALRRARAGITNEGKPLGTFLFLGPTGVGKTETAKALAEAMFGNEDVMSRLDMSEFQGDAALEMLIGSQQTGEPGRLATLLREHQYGVLLLDEFEKSDRSVHDLFLQILDEGQFSDATGRRVNARNVLIIATSNAGADTIWKWEQQGKDLSQLKRTLIDHLVKQGLYRPEFLNRFDDIVMFQPLSQEQVHKIAQIHLTNLAQRLQQERNITLTITDELIARVAEKGYDPQFGGRPLVHAIQEEVEQIVADEILKGSLHAGDTITYHDRAVETPVSDGS